MIIPQFGWGFELARAWTCGAALVEYGVSSDVASPVHRRSKCANCQSHALASLRNPKRDLIKFKTALSGTLHLEPLSPKPFIYLLLLGGPGDLVSRL